MGCHHPGPFLPQAHSWGLESELSPMPTSAPSGSSEINNMSFYFVCFL